MSATLLVLLYVTGIYLVSVDAGSCPAPQPGLYPFGLDRSDTAITEGDADLFAVDIGRSIAFYGNNYYSVYVSVDGILSFGQPYALATWDPAPTSFPVLAPFWGDVVITPNTESALYFRKVNTTKEADVVSLVEIDSLNAGLPISPDVILIFTWYKVCQISGSSHAMNTFQAVLASDGNKTIAIFNYRNIDWFQTAISTAAVMFSKGDQRTRVDYSISRTDEMLNIAEYSNVGIPGTIVTRVDGDIQLQELTKPECASCVIDRFTGDLITFDGSQELNVHGANRKYLVSKVYQGELVHCKFMLKVVTGVNGSIDWVSFTVNSNLKRNFAFERKRTGVAEVRGRNKKMVITSFPYIEVIEDEGQQLTIVVEKLDDGWMVHSPTCQYYLVYRPRDAFNQLRLLLGPYYQNKVFAMCQNNNNDATDDRKKCSMPPEDVVGDDFVTVIGDSCSCPRANKQCTKQLNRL